MSKEAFIFLFHRTSPRANFSRAESANRHCRAVKRSLKRSENSLFGHLIHLDAYLSPGLRFRIRIWDPGPLQWFHSIKQTHFFLLQNHGYRRTPRMFEVFDLYTDQFHWVIVVFGGSEVTLFDLVELNRNSRWSKVQVFFWGNSCLSLHFHKKKRNNIETCVSPFLWVQTPNKTNAMRQQLFHFFRNIRDKLFISFSSSPSFPLRIGLSAFFLCRIDATYPLTDPMCIKKAKWKGKS